MGHHMKRGKHIVVDGPIEIIFGEGEVTINSLQGELLKIHNARNVVLHYLDHGETELYGDLDTQVKN